MYIDRSRFDEYSFTGEFYTISDDMPADGDMLGDDDENSSTTSVVETVVYTTKCDIQETNKMMATDTAGSYLDIFFPFDTSEGVPVRIGHRFRSSTWFRPVDGRVYAVVPSPMGGCKARIKEVGIDELS